MIGIVVDDAIVVSENIQRHINEGMADQRGGLSGVKEMVLPVTLATLTTIAAFPSTVYAHRRDQKLYYSYSYSSDYDFMGSLLESFFFLPLHAEEFLKKQKNFINWEPLQEKYEALLHLCDPF